LGVEWAKNKLLLFQVGQFKSQTGGTSWAVGDNGANSKKKGRGGVLLRGSRKSAVRRSVIWVNEVLFRRERKKRGGGERTEDWTSNLKQY